MQFHKKMVEAILKHTKEPVLLSAWLQGKMRVKFWRGTNAGFYVGNKMLKLDSGLTVDASPASFTGVTYENLLTVDDPIEVMITTLEGRLEESSQLLQRAVKSEDMALSDAKQLAEENVLLQQKLQAYEVEFQKQGAKVEEDTAKAAADGALVDMGLDSENHEPPEPPEEVKS